ncbi:MAG: DMT family transporter [Clostridia bacterium]|nr:DMT family transporter [Clostridia bacterium]
MNPRIKDICMMSAMVLAWSVFYAVSKRMVDATGSAYAVGFLLRMAALLFLTAQIFLDGSWRTMLKQGKATALLLLIGVFGFLLDLFANLGYAGGSLSTGTALLKTDVLMVNLVTVAVMHKKLYATDWLGSFVMLAGVLLVLGIDFKGMTVHPTDLLFLLSAACVTANAFLIKHVQVRHGSSSDAISYYNNFMVLLLFAVFAFCRGDLKNVHASDIPGFWPLVLLGGLAQTCIYFFYYRNLKRHEVWIVKLWLLLMPAVSCLIGVVFLNEKLTAGKLIGIAVILIGAMIILLRDKLHPEHEKEETAHAA